MIEVRPISRDKANDVVTRWHSHHKKVRGCLFCLQALVEDDCVGVVIVGRPVARLLDDGVTYEVTRLCTNGHKNAASRLLGAVRRCRAMGVRRLVSYTREDEPGTCYRAAGWVAVAKTKAEGWNHGNKADRWLPGLYLPATEIVRRVRWEVTP